MSAGLEHDLQGCETSVGLHEPMRILVEEISSVCRDFELILGQIEY